MSNLIVNINPKVLSWARQEAGFSDKDIASKITIHFERYVQWEKTGIEVPFGKLKEISKHFKRQVAVFFLPEVPPKNKKPKDFRNLSPDESNLTPPTLLAMRRAKKYQEMIIDLESEEYWERKYVWQEEIKGFKKDSEIISWLRQKLNVSLEDQYKFRDTNQAYKKWREAIEDNLGILTFQFSMNIKEVQGFCYSDIKPYVIVTNGKHSEAGKIFTLFHEIAHILKHQSGICTPDNVTSNQQVEFDCNDFAGKFLLPANSIVNTEDPLEILNYSRKLKVSSEVYLRRMLEEKLILERDFFRLLEVIRKNVKAKKGFGIATPTQKSLNQRGVTFYNAVMEGLNTNKISHSNASDALGLAVKYLIRNSK